LLRTTFKVPYGRHVVEVENRPFAERLLVDGAEVDRRHGVLGSKLHAEVPEGGGTASIDARLDIPLWPPGLRCTVTINGAEVHREVKGSRAMLAFFIGGVCAGCLLACIIIYVFHKG